MRSCDLPRHKSSKMGVKMSQIILGDRMAHHPTAMVSAFWSWTFSKSYELLSLSHQDENYRSMHSTYESSCG